MNKTPGTTGLNFGAISSLITRIAPFLFPAVFFESGLLLVLSPLPLFLMTLKDIPGLSILALLSNAAIVLALQGKAAVPFAVWLWGIVGILFPILIKRFGRVVPSFWFCFGFGLAIFYVTLSVVALQENMGVVAFVKHEVAFNLEAIIQLPDSPLQKIVEEQGRDEMRRQIVDEIPSGIVITYLAVFWLNLLFASRFLRGFLTGSFWGGYKNPEWFVWPTLACGISYAFGKFAFYYIGLNGLKIFLAFYVLQGLSIISFLLTRYKILGIARLLVFLTSILIAMPLVLAVGFFDQWFDFRKKFGQSL